MEGSNKLSNNPMAKQNVCRINRVLQQRFDRIPITRVFDEVCTTSYDDFCPNNPCSDDDISVLAPVKFPLFQMAAGFKMAYFPRALLVYLEQNDERRN